jgi:uncharacterized membrane protein YoaT (DUF817 family)
MSRWKLGFGYGGTGLGSGLLGLSFYIDQTLLGPLTLFLMFGAMVAVLGSIGSVYSVWRKPDQFDLEKTVFGQQISTYILLSGAGSILAGLINITLAISG